MPPLLLPVGTQAAQTQSHHPRRQIGILLPVGQNQKPAVVDHKPQAPRPSAVGPANPLLPPLQVQGRRPKSDQRDPLSVQLGDIAERLPSQTGTLQVMLVFQPKIKLAAFLLAHQAHRHPPYHIGLYRLLLLLHGGVLKNPPPNVQLFLEKCCPSLSG